MHVVAPYVDCSVVAVTTMNTVELLHPEIRIGALTLLSAVLVCCMHLALDLIVLAFL